jgi:hypothetical protein
MNLQLVDSFWVAKRLLNLLMHVRTSVYMIWFCLKGVNWVSFLESDVSRFIMTSNLVKDDFTIEQLNWSFGVWVYILGRITSSTS